MNGTDRLERELTTWFADTAAPRVPDFTADILGATATMRQRPRWSFPTRWLPAALVPRMPRWTVRPLPWRTIALLALIGLLLAAAREPLCREPASASGAVRACRERPGRLWRARRDLDGRPRHRGSNEDRLHDRWQQSPAFLARRDPHRVPPSESRRRCACDHACGRHAACSRRRASRSGRRY
jgi:hypothetical protein